MVYVLNRHGQPLMPTTDHRMVQEPHNPKEGAHSAHRLRGGGILARN